MRRNKECMTDFDLIDWLVQILLSIIVVAILMGILRIIYLLSS